jgi:hypothetical protein
MRIAILLVCGVLYGERTTAAQGTGTSETIAPVTEIAVRFVSSTDDSVPMETKERDHHAFWDKTNEWLFGGVAASRTLDYFSTLNMRRRGRQEILLTNGIVENHGAFAGIEAAGAAVSVGAAYLFHYYGHHKLERWTSVVHIGLATTGAVHNYCLKTKHR